MSDVFLLYLFTRLDAFGAAMQMLAFVSAFAAFVLTIGSLVEPEDFPAKHMRNPVLAIFCVSAFLALATPSKTDMAIIVGGKLAIDAARTPEAKELAGELYEAVMYQLKAAQKKDGK